MGSLSVGGEKGGVIRFHRRGVVFFRPRFSVEVKPRPGTGRHCTNRYACKGHGALLGRTRGRIIAAGNKYTCTRSMDHKGFRFRLPRAGACAYRLFWNHGYGRDAVLHRSALPRTLTVRVGTGWNAGPGNSPAVAVLCDWLVPLYRVFLSPQG